MASDVRVAGPDVPRSDEVLTPEALAVVGDLHRRFAGPREVLLTARAVRREQIAKTGRLDFLAETGDVRAGEWYFYLPELAGHLEARRWDYRFSIIKNFRDAGPAFVVPDRSAVTMAALIPSRRDAAANKPALAGVRADKERPAGDGFDGPWVVHPDLVPVCREVLDAQLGGAPNQLSRLRTDVNVTAEQLLDIAAVPGGRTEAGLRGNIEVAIRYLAAWLGGNGAVGIHGLMEDAATAEISRSQVWHWIAAGVRLDAADHQAGDPPGEQVTAELVTRLADEELTTILAEPGVDAKSIRAAHALLPRVALAEDFPDFLTLPAHDLID